MYPSLSLQREVLFSFSFLTFFFFFQRESRYGIGRNTNEQTNKKPREIIFALNHAETGPLLSNGIEQPRKFRKKWDLKGKDMQPNGFCLMETFCRNACSFASSPTPVSPAPSTEITGMARVPSSSLSSRLPFVESKLCSHHKLCITLILI